LKKVFKKLKRKWRSRRYRPRVLFPHGDILKGELTFGENVGFGVEAVILPQAGVIGDSAIIGARAVVTRQGHPKDS
jgi:acetyltransferase-like isoleucine patch superfamily enzyme